MKIGVIFVLWLATLTTGHIVFTDNSKRALRIQEAGPSWGYLPPKRKISIRAEHCSGEGRMLPLQRYHSKRVRPHNFIPLKEEQKNCTHSTNDNQNKANTAIIQSILENPAAYNLSKSSQYLVQKYQTLTQEEQRHLIQKIQVEQRASQPLPLDALEILYCDAHICVANKPSGVLSVPGPRRNPSLANLVYETLHPMIDIDQMVVHRLDMATSGIIVYALSLEALSKLQSDFRNRRVKKTYQALIKGHDSVQNAEGEVDVAMERDPNNPPFMRIAQPKADISSINGEGSGDDDENGFKVGPDHKFWKQAPKESLTNWKLLGKEFLPDDAPVTRLELLPETGRTHQLRYGHFVLVAVALTKFQR